MTRLTLLFAGALSLSVACGSPLDPRADHEPWSSTMRGRATMERAVTRGRARDVLGQLDPATRATLDELMFLADLQMASGNESDALRIFRRVQRELAEPRTVPAGSVALVLEDMARVMDQPVERGADPYGQEDYERVTKMLASAQGAFPSAGVCLDRIASMPDEVAVAFFVQEWFADDHYHDYWMKDHIFGIVTTGGYGPLPLVIIEDRLRDSWPYHSPESEWFQAVEAGRAIVGEDFEDWYREVRGRSYAFEWLGGWF
jgi:hypothetical protein